MRIHYKRFINNIHHNLKSRSRLKCHLYLLGGLSAMFLAGVSCASIGNPTGGPRDEEPPIFVGANPPMGATNVNRQRISLEFNEIVNVKDAFNNVVVSPPSSQPPRVTASGKRVNVVFSDTLLPNTTYTIDFGSSIEDNNEGNKLSGMQYYFSTGEEIDTLQISGMVLSADNLEPQQGMLVGVYANLSDTAFATLPFERMAKTDDRGRFTILGLKPGEYRIFALNDLDNDYHRANPEEAMAFYDVTIHPESERVVVTDSIYNFLTGQVDTVLTRERTRFLPNDILLRSFESDYKSQYLQKYERIDSTRLSFIFNAPSDSLPEIEAVGFPELGDWFVLESSPKNDTLTYWIKEPSLVSLDSLRISARYLRTDSAQKLSAVTDTLRFFYSREMKKALADAAKAKEKEEKEKEKALQKARKNQSADTVALLAADSVPPKPTPLGLKVITSSTHEVYMPVYFEFETPLLSLDTAAFKLEIQVDSIWKPVPLPWKVELTESSNPRNFKVEYPWQFSTQYRLTLDSLAAEGIYGLKSDPLDFSFKTKSPDDYSTVIFEISNFVDTVPAFMELLNTSDAPVKRVPVENGKAVFKYLAPGKYYARIFEDFNGNGIYDTGNLDSLQLPDMAYYYPKLLNVKQNWERSETWSVFDTAIDLMKPEAIKKNKPEADKRSRNKNNNRTDEEEDEEEYFDPTRNPFDPNDRGYNRR